MCRLFAVRSEAPVRVEQAFVGLARLAHEHKDGWGVARFDGHPPSLETNLTPAHACARFEELGRTLETRCLLAHIRLKSVGAVSPVNAHPFFAEGWAFMHNGTLKHFADGREALESELAPRWRARLRGETDSERCFFLFMTFLEQYRAPGLADVARCLARTMRLVCERFDRRGERASALNFVVSDGARLLATRRGRTLHVLEQPGVRALASEPLWSDPAWHPVPEDTLIGFEDNLSRQSWTLDEL